jgi:hypothetical protein
MAKKFPQNELVFTVEDENSQNTALPLINIEEFIDEGDSIYDDGDYFSEEEFTYDEEELSIEEELIEAAANGDLEKVNWLIEAGTNVNDFDEIGNTALMYAARNGYLDIAKSLITAGADIDCTSLGNMTLFAEGAPIELVIRGNTPLIHAARNGHSNIVELLLSLNADAHHINELRKSALDIAIQKQTTNAFVDDYLKCVDLLTEAMGVTLSIDEE